LPQVETARQPDLWTSYDRGEQSDAAYSLQTLDKELRSVFSVLLSLFKSHTQLHLEVLFLRKRLEIVARSSPRLRVNPSDRFLIGILTDLYDSWKEALLIVQPRPSSVGCPSSKRRPRTKQ
jgi:hypothetical protein